MLQGVLKSILKDSLENLLKGIFDVYTSIYFADCMYQVILHTLVRLTEDKEPAPPKSRGHRRSPIIGSLTF